MNNNKINLALLIPSLRRGGAERVVSRLSFILNKEFNLHVVIFDGEKIDYEVSSSTTNLDTPGINTQSILTRAINSLKRIYKYKKFKRSNNIDVTYSFGNTANLVNILSTGNDKKITSVRGYGNLKLNEENLLSSIISLLIKYSSNKADKIISVSELIKKTMVNAFDIDNEKISVIYNGIDTNEIINKSKEKSEDILLDKLEIFKKEKNFVFVSMGSYRREKGYDILMEAFSKLKLKYPSVKLLIIGNGSQEATNKILKLIDYYKLSEDVLLTGFQKNPYVFLRRADCYVLSSRSEGFPNALIESMALSLPVISLDCPSGPREILKESINNNGKIVEKNYGVLIEGINNDESNFNKVVLQLTNSMEIMLNDKPLRKKLQKMSRQRAAHFSFENWQLDHINLINEIFYNSKEQISIKYNE